MKRTLKITVLLLALLLPILTMVSVAAVAPSQYSKTFLGELSEKYELLKNTKEPKIIVIGGSSVAFGLDSELLSAYMEMPVVNFGLYAQLGTNQMMELSKSGIGEGDIIIIAPEQSAQTLSMYCKADSTWQAADGNIMMLPALAKSDPKQIAAEFWSFFVSKLGYMREGALDPQGVYSSSSFNEYGDIVYPRPENTMRVNYDPGMPVSFSETLWSEEFKAYVNDYIGYAKSKGAEVYFSFCPMNEMALTEDTTDEAIDEYYKFLASTLDCHIISDPRDYILPYGYFYDSNFHLNDLGVTVRTKNLITDLYRERGIVKPVDIETVPAPTNNREMINDDTVYEDEYFIYTTYGSYLSVVDVTVAARGMKTLTIPAEVDGKTITGIAPGAFVGCTEMTDLYIPSNIISLPDESFRGCPNLRAIHLAHISCDPDPQDPTQRVAVGYNLFRGCENAGNIKIYLSNEGFSNFAMDYYWANYSEYMAIES